MENYHLITVRWPASGGYSTIAISATLAEWIVNNRDKESYSQPVIIFSTKISEEEYNRLITEGFNN